jgi:hypothetical protein
MDDQLLVGVFVMTLCCYVVAIAKRAEVHLSFMCTSDLTVIAVSGFRF